MKPVILITGASRGIGAATALQAARAGYTVVVNYHTNARAANEVVRQIGALGANAIAVQADVAKEEQVLANDSDTPQTHVRYQRDRQHRVRA